MAKRKAMDAEDETKVDSDEDSEDWEDDSDTEPMSDQKVKYLNGLTPDDFKNNYIDAESLKYSTKRSGDTKEFHIDFLPSKSLSRNELTECYRLIETTSRHDYEASSIGWHESRKKREIKEDEMRYLLVRPSTKPSDQNHKLAGKEPILGFLSFMLTHDSIPAQPVLYVYEIHLSSALRNLGLGAHLMDIAEQIAENVKMEKVMLTCFLSNKHAHSFYMKRGYSRDVCSPEDRKTRTKVVKADHVIMSKPLIGWVGDGAMEASNGG